MFLLRKMQWSFADATSNGGKSGKRSKYCITSICSFTSANIFSLVQFELHLINQLAIRTLCTIPLVKFVN